MKEFEFLNLFTRYKCIGDIEINYLNNPRQCFYDAFKRGNELSEHKETLDVDYTIYINKNLEDTIENRRNNFCIFGIDEIKKHLEIGKKEIFLFKYKIINKKKFYYINLNISGNFFYHKLILTWVRYLYEFPTNMLLRDTYLLKKTTPELKFENILNLYNIVAGCYKYNDYKFDQTISWGGSPFMTIKEFKERINVLSREGKSSNIIKKIYNNLYDPRHKFIIMPRDNRFDIEYWTSPSEFEARKNNYLEFYKKRKEESKK